MPSGVIDSIVPTFTPDDPHLVARIGGRGGREVRGDRVGAEERLAHQERRARDEGDGQGDGRDGDESSYWFIAAEGLLVAECR